MPPRRTRCRRRGATVGTLLIGTVILAGLAAIVVDLALLRLRHKELNAGCTSAALAGGSGLFDPELFEPTCPYLKALVPSTMEVEMRAVEFAANNKVGGEPLVVDPAQGDLEFQSVIDPTMFDSPLDVSGMGPINSIVVRCARTEARSNPITLVFARVLGIDSKDLTVRVRATLDQRVCGFRPVPLGNDSLTPPATDQSTVPMVPIVVDPAAWDAGACAMPTGTNDNYDCRGGFVAAGPDGIPEFSLTLNVDSMGVESGDLRLLVFTDGATAPALDGDKLLMQIIGGLTIADLNEADGGLGGEFKFDTMGKRDLDIPPAPDDVTLMKVCGGLNMISAVMTSSAPIRVWPLGSDMAGKRQVTNFAAAVVIDCVFTPGDPSTLTVTLQPCLLVSKTAITTDFPRNPYIGKLIVTQ
jgi:hypothetical protein